MNRLGIVLLLAASPAMAVDVTTCGHVITRGELGTLVADLDCGGPGVRGVVMGGGTLELNGFTIRGAGRGVGIECVTQDGTPRPTCTVRGPGLVTGFEIGINGAGCTVSAAGLTIRGNESGIALPLAGDLEATDLVVTENGVGIWAQGVRGSGLVVSGNTGDGVNANRRLRVRSLTAIGNGAAGVRARQGRLVDSRVVGSGGFDVLASGRLRLVRTACENSGRVRRRTGSIIGELGCRAP